MARSIRFLAWSLFAYALHLSTASAQSIDFSFLSCFTQSAPSSSIQLTPSDTQRISIGVGSQYYTEPRCYHQIVQFTVPSNAGTNLPPGFPYYTQHQEFSFDSLVNERIDTSAKCSTYAQQTVLFRKQGAGNWTVLAFTRLTGTWSNNKCRIKVVAGDSDFRDRTYSPRWNGTDYYRLASRVTTGNSTKVPRSVCVGLRFADIQDVPRPSCEMPQ